MKKIHSLLNEANGEELLPIINNISSGKSPFGNHENIKIEEIDNNSPKDCIIAYQNAWVDFCHLYSFDDW